MIENNDDRLDALRRQFPSVIGNANLPWGLECSAGWDRLLTDLLTRIDAILSEHPNCSVDVLQIKEKFGALRFYCRIDGDDDAERGAVSKAISKVVHNAEALSTKICEGCGKPSSIRNSGVLTTRCLDCASRR